MREGAKRSKNLREFWKGKLQECQANSLSGPNWCRANQLLYHQFISFIDDFFSNSVVEEASVIS